MQTRIVPVDFGLITDEQTFHDVFTNVFGFGPSYGRNMDAWIDCMGHVANVDAEMTTIKVDKGGLVVIAMDKARSFKARCPSLYENFLDCVAFVNLREKERGDPPLLAVLMYT